jgi:hypothetical protein
MSTKVVDFITKMWQKVSILSKKVPIVYYVIVFFVLVIFVTNEAYLWHKDAKNTTSSEQQKMAAKEDGDFVIVESKKDDVGEFMKESQGTADSGFESTTYGLPKNTIAKNSVANLAKDKMHSGKNSLHINRDGKKDSSVRLNNFIVLQKDQYYKLGLWISSAQSGNFTILVANGEGSFPIATVGVVANQGSAFSYYEYNFRAPADASHMDLSFSGASLHDVYIDDVKIIPLDINNQKDLSTITVTAIGNSQSAKMGESQLSKIKTSDALKNQKTLLGQVFTSPADNITGVSFALTKKGDGGIGEYSVELRNFDEKSQTVSGEKIAIATFKSDAITSDTTVIPLFAQIEKGKKYWIGINNTGVKINKDHHLVVGQAENMTAYPKGDGFAWLGGEKTFTKINDLYFTVYYAEHVKMDNAVISYGETLYDLGRGKSRAYYHMDPVDGSNIIDLYAQNNIIIDKWKNISLRGDGAYIVYKIGVNGKKIDKVIFENIFFHNNISISISSDEKKWTEIFADNPGTLSQNSGKIEVSLKNDSQNIFVKMKKNGDGNSFFLGGRVILDLVDQNYGK